jgi:hypothetical protein
MTGEEVEEVNDPGRRARLVEINDWFVTDGTRKREADNSISKFISEPLSKVTQNYIYKYISTTKAVAHLRSRTRSNRLL